MNDNRINKSLLPFGCRGIFIPERELFHSLPGAHVLEQTARASVFSTSAALAKVACYNDNREKLSLYYENKNPSVPLAENKEFRSIKNLIIRTVLEMPVTYEWTIQHSMMAAQTMIVSLARMIGDKCLARRQVLQEQIDSKLQAKIQEKKQALGLRTEPTQKPTYQTQEEYNMSM